MANIKFSAFTTETNQSNIDFIVGYQGTTMKKIAPSNLGGASGTGTTGAITKWNDGPNGVLGDSIMVENATQVDLTGEFVCSSSPTAVAGPISALRANQATTTNGAFNIALYGDTKHTGATGANSNYGIYTKAEFEGTGGFTGIILGGYFEGRYDGSGVNGANASLYGSFAKARVTAPSSGDIQYVIANNVTSAMDAGTTTDVEFLQGQHTNVTFNGGNISGDIAVELLDFDYTAGTLQGDFAYIQIQNDTVPTPVTGTARAINVDSLLPSRFAGDVRVEGDLDLNAGLLDSTASLGTADMVLCTDGSVTEWRSGYQTNSIGYKSTQVFQWLNGTPTAYVNFPIGSAAFLPFNPIPLFSSVQGLIGATVANYQWSCVNLVGTGPTGIEAEFTLGANGGGTWEISTAQHWFDQDQFLEVNVAISIGGVLTDVIDERANDGAGNKLYYGSLIRQISGGTAVRVRVDFQNGSGAAPFPSDSGNRPIEITFKRIS